MQVTKDPVGHKGARLTGQVSLPGRFLVYVPDGNTSGISRKLPDTERNRLKTLLKQIVPDTAGVIVRTAAEGASEEELTLDVERLTARWTDIEEKVKAGKSPQLLYGEPDLTLKVVRDLFTEDFAKLVVQGDDAWDLVDELRLPRRPRPARPARALRAGARTARTCSRRYRIDEQIAKGLDRKVWLPSGGSLIIDRTEAMTVVDVNTGKFTGSGGNLEETVTKNNLEAAEEMVRQLRLRDIGGIIVIDFIDMVLESNRDLVLRRLVECLGRDRTRHQVAEVTSLGLVQMTRKRIGTGLLEAFSTDCEHCKGRGLVVHDHPVESGGRPTTTSRAGDAAAAAATAVAAASGDDNGDERGNGSAGERRPSPHRPTWPTPGPRRSRPTSRRAGRESEAGRPRPSSRAARHRQSRAERRARAPAGPPESGSRRATPTPEPRPPSRVGARAPSRRRARAASRAPSRGSRGAAPGHQHPPPYGATPGRSPSPLAAQAEPTVDGPASTTVDGPGTRRRPSPPVDARPDRAAARDRHPDPRRPDLARRVRATDDGRRTGRETAEDKDGDEDARPAAAR